MRLKRRNQRFQWRLRISGAEKWSGKSEDSFSETSTKETVTPQQQTGGGEYSFTLD